VTHGYRDELARWLAERGHAAEAVETPYEGERAEGQPAPADGRDSSDENAI
jgi:hypothetical protein